VADVRARMVAAVAAPVAGLGLFAWYCGQRYGSWRAPLDEQSAFRGDVVDPITRLVQGVGDLVGDERFGDGLHVPFAVLGIVLLVLCVRRWPASYSAFAGTLLVLALAAENLNSLERYLLAAFPLVLVLGELTRSTRAERLALALCGGGTMALTALALMDVYVP
jgi:hypothetical protein